MFSKPSGSGRDKVDIKDLREFALKEENWDSVASLLSEVLPKYVQLVWYKDTPYKRHFKAWQEAGVTILPNHYYSPVPDLNRLPPGALEARFPLHGIEMHDEAQLAFLKTLKAYAGEYDAFAGRTQPLTDGRWYLGGPFARPDADSAYAMVRHLKPKRIIEIGSGFSTLAMSEACLKNKAEGHPVEFISIDPYPSYVLSHKPAGLTRHIAEPLESLPLALFEGLGENDILFIDSTHIIRPGSDVEYEYFHLIPKVGTGAWVHVHDIFLPKPYPPNWITEEHIFWNEQHLLAAFLAFNKSFTVTLALNFLCDKYPDAIRDTFQAMAPTPQAGSFWFKRVD